MSAKTVDLDSSMSPRKCLTCMKPATKRVYNNKNELVGGFCEGCAFYTVSRLDELEKTREASRRVRSQ